MNIRKLIFYITCVFIFGTMILIAMQYTSNKNVQELIHGNEALLKEFQVTKKLAELQKDMLAFDNKLKNAIITGDSIRVSEFGRQLNEIEGDINELENANSGDSVQKYISDLNDLIHEKLIFSNEVADSFRHSGKPAAEKLFATEKGIRLSQEIFAAAERIDTSRQTILASTTESIDSSGRRAFRWEALTIAAVLILFTVLFCFILVRMKKQFDLIDRLNESEKKIREIAQVKENFLANMSHEIRTPMNAIIGYTNLLKRKSFDEETTLHLSTIQKSGESLLGIVNDILDVSKIEAGMMRMENAPFNVRELFYDIEKMFANDVSLKRLYFNVSINDIVPATLSGDANRLRQVLINIAGNAVKFTSYGGIHIKVDGLIAEDSRFNLSIIVSDTGIGIDPEKLDVIFERFIQEEQTASRRFGGTGLGLSIVRNIVELQHGTISIAGSKNEGTSVAITIPYKLLANTGMAAAQPAFSALQPFQTTFAVLLVEDNIINQTLLAHLVKSWQLGLVIVSNGMEALTVMGTRSFDLVLMDIQMPGMDGYTVTKLIREQLHSMIPIVAITAHAMPGEKEQCLQAGMDGYIPKPVDEAELYHVIDGFVKRKAAAGIINAAEIKYKVISLDYMHQISRGNKIYEQTVTRQFIKILPVQLSALSTALKEKNYPAIKSIAHNLRSTISIMGLDTLIGAHLEEVENGSVPDEQLRLIVNVIITTCNDSMDEATHFLAELMK